MRIYAYAAAGFAGRLVAVEVDIRRGIPALDIVGLPDGAVRESRERVRAAIRRSGYQFPTDRILVNLSPADLKKEGASYDLPIAAGILAASGQIDSTGEDSFLCVGELLLNGRVQAVAGVLPAVAAAHEEGVNRFVVPRGNLREAAAVAASRSVGLGHLRELSMVFGGSGSVSEVSEARAPGDSAHSADSVHSGKAEEAWEAWEAEKRGEAGEAGASRPSRLDLSRIDQDLSEIRGQAILRRVLEIAASGGHHLLVFGPPGSGKTMGVRALAGLLPDMTPERSVEVTRIWSQAGRLGVDSGRMVRPPFRDPHHSSTAEGLIGGAAGRPGEASLAHGGVLFLDETPEFGAKVLQSLREPLESRRIDMARAGRQWWYPANFQLVMAMNPCPCGNLGREESCCLCTPPEISRHWRKLGGALLDRVDMRIAVSPVNPECLLEPPGEGSESVRCRVRRARERQSRRYSGLRWNWNADIPPGELSRHAALNDSAAVYFSRSVSKLGLSSRAAHGVLRVARTLADMAGRDRISPDDVLEAVQHRRFGDRDLFWTTL